MSAQRRGRSIRVTEEMAVAGAEFLRTSGRLAAAAGVETDLALVRDMLETALACRGQAQYEPHVCRRINADAWSKDKRQIDMASIWDGPEKIFFSSAPVFDDTKEKNIPHMADVVGKSRKTRPKSP